jgi:integrase
LAINLEPLGAKIPKAPLPYTVIERALSTYGNSLPELRTQALVLIAWSTMLRRSELVARRVCDWRPAADRYDGTLFVERTKGKKKVQFRYVTPPARAQLERWLEAAGLTGERVPEEMPLFPRLNRNGLVSRTAPKALHPNEVALAFKDVARRGGLSELEVKRIAGHSTRIGATHALAKSGASLLQVQQAGGWESPQMPAQYLREQEASDGAMAQWYQTQVQPVSKRTGQ